MENTKLDVLACVASPLQLLNVYMLMKKLQLESCSVLIIDDGKSSRHLQIIRLAEKLKLESRVVNYAQVACKTITLLKRFFTLFRQKGLYDYVILGDYRDYRLNVSLALNVRKTGKVFFVDDGNASVGILKGYGLEKKSWLYYRMFDVCSKLKCISWKNYFTAYDSEKSPFFNILQNDFFESLTSLPTKKEVFFLGTVMDVLAKEIGMNYDDWPEIMEKCFSFIRLRWPEDKILYIPHGRDAASNIKHVCDKYDVEIKSTDQCVEMYCLEKGAYPCAVYGFFSSALFNLKKMNPKTISTSFYLKAVNKKSRKIYDDIRFYYEANFIEFVDVSL